MERHFLQPEGLNVIPQKSEAIETSSSEVFFKLNLVTPFLDLASRGNEDSIKSLILTPQLSLKEIRKMLCEVFNLNDPQYVLKVRNTQGSLVPISSALSANSPENPYLLEVCVRYQHVTPLPRTLSIPTYEELLRRKLQSIHSRLNKLDEGLPGLPQRRSRRIDDEIRELNEKMNVLDRRLGDSDNSQWKGMFQRNPLW